MFLMPDENSRMSRQSTSSEKRGIPLSWILLDSQSTVDVFCNATYINPIQP